MAFLLPGERSNLHEADLQEFTQQSTYPRVVIAPAPWKVMRSLQSLPPWDTFFASRRL